MDTKIITILNIIFFLLGSIILGTSYLVDSDMASNIGTVLILIFALLSFAQLLAKGTLFYNKQYFYPIIFFVFLSFAPPAMNLSYARPLQTVGIIGVLVAYAIWFLKKESKMLLDFLKLIFVSGFAVSLFLEVNNILIVTGLSNAIFVLYVVIVGFFYNQGIRNGELMK